MSTVTRIRPYRVISGVGAGAGAALVMIVVMALLRFGFQFPTLPELMLNSIVRFLGGESFSAALDKLYYAGRPLLFTIVLEGTLVLGVVLGLIYAAISRPNPRTGVRSALFDNPLAGLVYGLIIGVLLNVVFLPIIGQPIFASQPNGIYSPSPIPLWAGLMLLAIVFGVTLQGLLPKPPAPELLARATAAPAASTDLGTAGAPVAVSAPLVVMESAKAVDRRSFLRIGGGAAAALIGGLVFWYGGTALNGGFRSVTSGAPSAGDAGSADTGTGTGGVTSGDVGTPVPTDTAGAAAAVPPTDTPASSEPATNTPEAQAGEPTATAGESGNPPTATGEPPAPTQPPTAVAQSTPTTATASVPDIKVAEIVPVASFYHVSKNFFDPSPSSDGWTLEIKGLVNNPYSLTYKQLTSLPAITVTTGMMCISNPIGGSLIGNQTWKGVHLADLLKKANPKSGVVDVVCRAVDDYSDSFPFQKAMDPDVMLVWEMGGKPLEASHGFPARLLVPGIYGMKHVKWLTSLELVNTDYKGFWQDPSQGWSDPAPVNTMSRIDLPTDGTLTAGKTTVISGVAFAGDRSISKVEVSTDNGKTWNQAYVKKPASQTSWVLWGYNWTPVAGKYTVMVRATDGKGNVQTALRTDPYPNGATGYHAVTYQVKGGTGQIQTTPDVADSDYGIIKLGPKRRRAPNDPVNN